MGELGIDYEITHDLLTFFLQTHTINLSFNIVKEMISSMKSNMKIGKNDYIHPTGIIVIGN